MECELRTAMDAPRAARQVGSCPTLRSRTDRWPSGGTPMTAIQFSRDHARATWPCVSPRSPASTSTRANPRMSSLSGPRHPRTIGLANTRPVVGAIIRRCTRALRPRVRGWWSSKPTCIRRADAVASACPRGTVAMGRFATSNLHGTWTAYYGVPPRRVHPPRGLCRVRPRPRLAARPSASRPAHAYISG